MNSPKLSKSTSKERRDSSAVDLVNNVEALAKLFGHIKSDEFTELLYALFEAHGKVKELFNCAIAIELADIQSASAFKFSDNSILLKLMLLLIHSDFGRKYLKCALDPLFQKCLSFTADINESSFVEEVTYEFLKTLIDYAERCPISFQEVLILLSDALKEKFPNDNIVSLLLCNEFLCDVIERPTAYAIIDENDKGTKGDPATVKHLKELVDSNQVVNVEKAQKEAEERMQQYLKGDKLQKTFQEQLLWEEKRSLLLNITEDNENWKRDKGDKKYGIHAWIKKYDWSPLVVWRFESTFKTSFAKFKSVVIDHGALLKRDERVEVEKEVKLPSSNSNRHYYYFRTKASFPVSARDFFIVRHDEWAEKEGRFYIYSVEHEDYPKFPKIVRAHVSNTCGHVTTNEDDTEVKIVQVDPRGNFPMWMVNKWGDGFVSEIKRHHIDVAKMQ